MDCLTQGERKKSTHRVGREVVGPRVRVIEPPAAFVLDLLLEDRWRVRPALAVAVEEDGVAVRADADILEETEVRERRLARPVPPADGAATVAAGVVVGVVRGGTAG